MKQILVSTVIALLVSLMLSLAGRSTSAAIADLSSDETQPTSGNNPCEGASVLDEAARQSVEERILNSTVRIYVDSWQVEANESGYTHDSKVGHATIMDGRFLVTHNHYSHALGGEQEGEEYTLVRVRTLQGDPVIDLPLTEVSITVRDEQALVIDLGEQGASALRSLSSVQSAEFAICQAEDVRPGTTVAQVDWDGEKTRVDWTTVSELQIVEGATRMVLVDGVKPGASGGGVFLNGRHVANNWTLMQTMSEDGQVLGEASSAALNTPLIATLNASA